MSVKGSWDRTKDKKKYDSCPLWENLAKKKGTHNKDNQGQSYVKRNATSKRGIPL